ncbi:MAG: zinc ribbon domain-containing protein [Chloroflexota bacterium]
MKKCPYCPAEIQDAAIVCPYCGRDLMKTVPLHLVVEPNTWKQARRRRSVIKYIIPGLVFTFMIACLVVFFIVLWNSY